MRIVKTAHGIKLWASARDTAQWARKGSPTGWWPCSELSGRRLFAEFASNGDLVDMALDGGRGEQDIGAAEFGAFVEDALNGRLAP